MHVNMSSFWRSKTTWIALLGLLAIGERWAAGQVMTGHALIGALIALASATLRDALRSQTEALARTTWLTRVGPGNDLLPPSEGDGADA